MIRPFLTLSIACILAFTGLVAADPIPSSRFATVEIGVTDKGKPVTGLDKADFQLFVDGKSQQIVSFRAVAEAAETSPDPPAGTRQGKTVMILFDVHAMTSAQAQIAQTAAVKYVESHMRRHDLFAVAVYGRNLQIAQPFTIDVERVIGAIRRPLMAFGTGKLEKGFSGDEGLQLGKNALISLRSLCEDLSEIRGPKSVLIFSEDFFAPSGEQYPRLVESARRAKVAFYTLITTQASAEARPRNRARASRAATLSSFGFSSFAPQQQQQRGGAPASTPTGPTGSGISDPSGREDVTKADQTAINSDVLQALAKETNGDYVRESNNLTKALDEFDRVLSNYYVLGFVASSPMERCKVEVKTSRKGMRLSYPKAFYAPEQAPLDRALAKKLSSALESPVAKAQPSYQLRSLVLKSEQGLSEVVLYISSKAASEASAMAASAWNEDGTPAGYFQAIKKESQARLTPVTFTLRPGKYRVKLAVANREGEVTVAEQPVTVPEYSPDQMAAGDLVVSAQVTPLPDLIRGVPGWLIEGHPLVFKGYEITPSMDNRSPREKPLPLFFHLFNAGSGELVSDPRLTDESGQTTLLSAVRHLNTADPGADGTVALGFSIPVANLHAGKYHLRIHTRGAAGKEPAMCETDVWLE